MLRRGFTATRDVMTRASTALPEISLEISIMGLRVETYVCELVIFSITTQSANRIASIQSACTGGGMRASPVFQYDPFGYA